MNLKRHYEEKGIKDILLFEEKDMMFSCQFTTLKFKFGKI